MTTLGHWELRGVDTSHLIVAFLERGDMRGSEHMYGQGF